MSAIIPLKFIEILANLLQEQNSQLAEIISENEKIHITVPSRSDIKDLINQSIGNNQSSSSSSLVE